MREGLRGKGTFAQLHLLYRRGQYQLVLTMKGKRLVNQHHPAQPLPQKTIPSRLAPKRKLQEVRSQESRYRPRAPDPPPQLPSPKLIRPQHIPPALDYDFQRRERQTFNYIPIASQPEFQPSPPIFRSQRNSDTHDFLQSQRQNNFLNHSNRSQQHSTPRIKIFSTDNKDKSLSRSQRSVDSSVKRRGGIELTKTLLKRISGMYNDKDFQNKSSYIKSTRQQTTGLSVRVQDQYQLSDFDFQIHNNTHTFNISQSNQLSFNDSWQKNNQSGQWNGRESEKLINQESGHWGKGGSSGMEVKKSMNKQETRLKPQQYQQTNTPYGPRMILKDSRQSYQPILRPTSNSKTKVHFTSSPKKQLVKARSYDLLNTDRPISQSIQIGCQPPFEQGGYRSRPSAAEQQQRYVIQSKNKTLQQLSVKQSMVLGFDNYYN